LLARHNSFSNSFLSVPFAFEHRLGVDATLMLVANSKRQYRDWHPIWLCGCIVMLVRWAWQWQSACRLVNEAAALDEGREVDALRQAEAKARICPNADNYQPGSKVADHPRVRV
jgi:hypothetical protein